MWKKHLPRENSSSQAHPVEHRRFGEHQLVATGNWRDRVVLDGPLDPVVSRLVRKK